MKSSENDPLKKDIEIKLKKLQENKLEEKESLKTGQVIVLIVSIVLVLGIVISLCQVLSHLR